MPPPPCSAPRRQQDRMDRELRGIIAGSSKDARFREPPAVERSVRGEAGPPDPAERDGTHVARAAARIPARRRYRAGGSACGPHRRVQGIGPAVLARGRAGSLPTGDSGPYADRSQSGIPGTRAPLPALCRVLLPAGLGRVVLVTAWHGDGASGLREAHARRTRRAARTQPGNAGACPPAGVTPAGDRAAAGCRASRPGARHPHGA